MVRVETAPPPAPEPPPSQQSSTMATLVMLLLILGPAAAQIIVPSKSSVPSAGRKLKDLVCPPFHLRQPTLLTLACTRQADCLFGDLCCPTKPGSRKALCLKGVSKPLEEQAHDPLLGLVPVACPDPPVAELLPVTKCNNDTQCWPRVCCPDGQQRFCRTPQPHWEMIPSHLQLPVFQSVRSAMKYLQCSAPPEPIFDLFPRPCKTQRDCFPDLCCQEGARKLCRRPRRSLLAFLSYFSPSTTPAPVSKSTKSSKTSSPKLKGTPPPSLAQQTLSKSKVRTNLVTPPDTRGSVNLVTPTGKRIQPVTESAGLRFSLL